MHWTLEDVRDLTLDEYDVLVEQLNAEAKDAERNRS